MSNNSEGKASTNVSGIVESPQPKNIPHIFKEITQKLFKKKVLLLIIIILIVAIGFLVVNKDNALIKKLSGRKVTFDLNSSKYNSDKGIRIFLKSGIADEEGDSVAKEFLKLEGVSGYSLIPVSLQKQYDKYNKLYPQKLSMLTPRNHIIIDLYVTDGSYINPILENLENNSLIQAISNISPN